MHPWNFLISLKFFNFGGGGEGGASTEVWKHVFSLTICEEYTFKEHIVDKDKINCS
jgi:hypothetical protein